MSQRLATDSPAPIDRQRARRAAIIAAIGIIATLALIVLFAGWSGEGNPHMGVEALIVLALNVPWAVGWLIAAYGLGWPLRLILARDADEPIALQFTLGIAAMLALTAALGRLGLLQLAGNLGAWAIPLLGIAFALTQLLRARIQPTLVPSPPANTLLLVLTAAPTVAVLLLATTSAPGWLWRTEFGGYDALSYHLQLPKEWLAAGAIMPLEHNVYSFLPSYVEGAFYHLMILHGDAIGAAYGAQLLHASFALLAAWLIARFALRLGSTLVAATIAAIVFIGTPWIVVTGSLAYNEMPVLVMLAGGLLVLREGAISPARRGANVGILTAAACGAKLTAVGFVAAPFIVLLLMSMTIRAWPKALLAGALAGLITLSPYLIGNAAATGNPVFPFAADVLGSGHWSDEQVAIWRDGHRATDAPGESFTEAWRQLFRYGIGLNPHEGEPWLPQWSILPWLAAIAIIAMLAWRAQRPWGVRLLIIIALQFLFWVGFTHIKSRFMLPLTVPGAVAIGVIAGVLLARCARGDESDPDERWAMAVTIPLAIALLIWSCVPVFIFANEANGAPAARVGLARLITGDDLSPSERDIIGRESLPSVYVNHLLPRGARVLFIGEAAPLYYNADFAYQTTWDRGPLSKLMRAHRDDPVAWRTGLREGGYTHLLISPVMLQVWEDAGWNDPNLTVERVMNFAEENTELLLAWPSGERLYRVPR